MPISRKPKNPGEWYSAQHPIYEALAKKVSDIISDVLSQKGIPCHSVTFRAKSLDSFQGKAKRYKDATTEIHDLAGIRVILFVEKEVKEADALIKSLFAIDKANSGDKSKGLGKDKVGYRSIHYVATLPDARTKLLEFQKFSGLKFEIQIRTLLQHAWAEIEHDRNYKFAGVLPEEFQRRLYLLAGVLEIADREFDLISKEVDEYAQRVKTGAHAKKLDIVIDSVSLRAYLQEKFEEEILDGSILTDFGTGDGAGDAVEELKLFGIGKLADLDRIIPPDLIKRYRQFGSPFANLISLVRDILIVNDPNKYFRINAEIKGWSTTDSQSIELWKCYQPDIQLLLDEYEIDGDGPPII